MNIVGIIAEYNPFHNGHLYHINKIKEELKADGIICVMSGNFVQRGEPAIFDKWARTKMALRGGVDLVFEHPVCFSTATAEIFAESSIKMLFETQVVKTISFGVEEYHKKELLYLGELLSDEPALLKDLIKSHLSKGMSFAAAREKAVIEYSMHGNTEWDVKLLSRLLKKSNAILAIEYIKAINKIKADFSIFPVLRKGVAYHDQTLEQSYASASGIRNSILNGEQGYMQKIAKTLPQSTFKIIAHEIEDGRGPVFFKDFEKTILYILRRTPAEEIRQYFDVSEGLENRIKSAAKNCSGLEDLISSIKSKRYPETKIQRILTHILLNIKRETIEGRSPLYIRVLGMSSKGAAILRKIKAKSSLPILTRASDYKSISPTAREMFELELLASDIYCLYNKNPEHRKGAMDFYRKIICYAEPQNKCN